MSFTIFEIIDSINQHINKINKLDAKEARRLIKKSQYIVLQNCQTEEINVKTDEILTDELEENIYMELYEELHVDKMTNNLRQKALKYFKKINIELYQILQINVIDQEKKYIKYQYSNPMHFSYINELIKEVRIASSKYHMEKVLYFFIVNNNIDMKNDYVLCKIGYTEDIDKRKKELEKRYGVTLTLINIKKVEFLRTENQFHKKIRSLYPHLQIERLNDVTTKETYIYNDILLDEFDHYHVDKKYEYKIEKEKTKQSKERTKQLSIISKLIDHKKCDKELLTVVFDKLK